VVEVASSFDEMADRVERTVQAQREFVSNASHQLRTPLTGIKLRIENAMADAGDSQRADLVAADHEVDRLSEIVNRLLVMSRQIESGAQTHVDIDEAAARAVDRWRERAERAGSSLELELGRSGGAQGNPADLDQVLDNLLDNAIAYAPGPIVVATGRRNGRIFVAVADRGPGIPAAEMARVTERFYRAAGTPGGGSGLGLAIARGLTEKWGGAMTISTREGGGLRVEVLLRSAHPDRGSGAGLDPGDSRKARPERPDPPIEAEPEEASP
jgi:signal transduction histidine kinase